MSSSVYMNINVVWRPILTHNKADGPHTVQHYPVCSTLCMSMLRNALTAYLLSHTHNALPCSGPSLCPKAVTADQTWRGVRSGCKSVLSGRETTPALVASQNKLSSHQVARLITETLHLATQYIKQSSFCFLNEERGEALSQTEGERRDLQRSRRRWWSPVWGGGRCHCKNTLRQMR